MLQTLLPLSVHVEKAYNEIEFPVGLFKLVVKTNLHEKSQPSLYAGRIIVRYTLALTVAVVNAKVRAQARICVDSAQG